MRLQAFVIIALPAAISLYFIGGMVLFSDTAVHVLRSDVYRLHSLINKMNRPLSKVDENIISLSFANKGLDSDELAILIHEYEEGYVDFINLPVAPLVPRWYDENDFDKMFQRQSFFHIIYPWRKGLQRRHLNNRETMQNGNTHQINLPPDTPSDTPNQGARSLPSVSPTRALPGGPLIPTTTAAGASPNAARAATTPRTQPTA